MEGVGKWVLLWGGGCGCEEESVGVRRSVCVWRYSSGHIKHHTSS